MREILYRATGLWLCLAATGLGDEPQTAMPVGTAVLAKRPDVQFRIKKQAIELMPAATVFEVREQQGEWIWLVRGWVRQQEVVRVCDAVEYFSGEIERSATAFAHASRSAALAYRGDRPRARADAERAVELDAEFASAFLCRAKCNSGESGHDWAMEDADEAIRLDPRYADAYNYRGLIWLAKDKPDRALKDFDRAIDLAPRMAEAYTNRGRAWMAKGEWQRALAEARHALTLDARQAMAHVVIGACGYDQEDYDLAKTEFDAALQLDPKQALARFHRGRLYARSGDYQKALVDLNQAVHLLPKSAEALGQRSYVYYRLGAMEKSRADRLAASRARSERHAVPRTTSPPKATSGKSANAVKDRIRSGSVPSLFHHKSLLTAEPGPDAAEENHSAAPILSITKRSEASWLNYAAWRMATSTDERYLNGQRAVELATEACELTEWKRAAFLDTLAAAYAEAGDFEAAVRWQTKAIELLRDESSKKPAEERIELYRNHQPYREK